MGWTKSKLKKRIICRKCCIVFGYDGKKGYAACPSCGRKISARIRTGQAKLYSKNHPDRVKSLKEYDKKYGKERRKAERELVRNVVFNLISNNNPCCANCGCDDKRLLEINHKNGGGGKELKKGKNTNVFMWDIYMGRRKTNDLNLLCRPCNSLHYLELKYGKLPLKILWNK